MKEKIQKSEALPDLHPKLKAQQLFETMMMFQSGNYDTSSVPEEAVRLCAKKSCLIALNMFLDIWADVRRTSEWLDICEYWDAVKDAIDDIKIENV